MKILMTMSLLLAGLAGASSAGATDHGDRVERRMDHRGDRIEARYDRRAAIADAHGRPGLAARLDAKGERIDRRLDRAGNRYDRRWDRRH